MTTQHTTREVIENKLLTALQDEGTAAILVSENDLSVMIRALEYAMLADREQTRKARELAKDYRKLLKAAFPEANVKTVATEGAGESPTEAAQHPNQD